MKIVSNTGSIIALGKIRLLFLLNQFASEVIISPTVRRELLHIHYGSIWLHRRVAT